MPSLGLTPHIGSKSGATDVHGAIQSETEDDQSDNTDDEVILRQSMGDEGDLDSKAQCGDPSLTYAMTHGQEKASEKFLAIDQGAPEPKREGDYSKFTTDLGQEEVIRFLLQKKGINVDWEWLRRHGEH
ncbi:hypothetical protein NW762_013869 [Fusarium torreyae]|uniref:Uncharacterized protein n=1 Tax=Fusarium torreyae TaxID=1237075 RepID=A0A9W8RMR1_9HYPO|nr:hypothetical protein NW762_013869 [Fusarium torreyae]